MLQIMQIAFGFICVFREFFRIRNNREFKLINIFGVMYGITYGFLPAIYFLLYYANGQEIGRIDYSSQGVKEISIWFVFAIFGYIFLNFFYSAIMRKRKIIVFGGRNTIQSNDEVELYRKLEITALICFLIGLISLFLWTKAYAGIISFIMKADQIRSRRGGIHNSLAFFSHPSRILSITTYIVLFLIKRGYKKVTNCVFFVVSLLVSTLYYLADDGRMSAAMFLCILLFIYVGLFDKEVRLGKKMVVIVIIGIIAMSFIMNLDSITSWIRYGQVITSSDGMGNGILSEFSYIIVSGQVAVRQWLQEGSPILLFQDIASGIFSWLPTSLKPNGLINVWNYNSGLVNPSFISQTPCDFITTSIYDAGLFGVIIFGFFWGRIIKWMDINKVQDGFGAIAYYSLSMTVLRLVNYCMLYDTILSLFSLFISYCVWVFVNKTSIRRV